MRLKLSRFRRNFNKDLPIEFTEQNLSSFGGLELFSRYLRRVELSRRVGKACRGKGIRSDYGSVRLVLVLVGMLLVGARRLEHLQYVCDDPMLLRFCGLRRLPSRPTIVNWLKQFTGERLKGLSELNGVLVHEQVERLGLNRLDGRYGRHRGSGRQSGWMGSPPLTAFSPRTRTRCCTSRTQSLGLPTSSLGRWRRLAETSSLARRSMTRAAWRIPAPSICSMALTGTAIARDPKPRPGRRRRLG